jgi:uncharacterized membrane protein HdeD (DUF308 family)
MVETKYEVEVEVVPWWAVLLEGIGAVLLALLLFAAPGTTLKVIVSITGFFWLVRGAFDIVTIFVDKTAWVWKLLSGILGIFAGLIVLQHPLWGAALLPATAAIILGIQAVLSGIFGLVVAFKGGGLGAGVIAVLSILLGIVLVANPLISGAVLVFVAAGLALVGGIASIVIAFRFRKA